jgi:hypothetical protein
LVAALNDPDGTVRDAVTNALREVAPELVDGIRHVSY